MANTLKIKRGTAATIPQGQLAEPLFTTDTYDLYIGKGSGGNQRIQNYIASGTSSQFLKGDGSLDSTTYQSTSEKGQNNGYASLDAGGKIPAAQLPSSVIEYKGTWNASTNTPTLADGTGDAGDVYIVSVGGTQNLGSGSITFDAGDWVMYNGSVWQKSTGSNAVASVNGQTGIVSIGVNDLDDATITSPSNGQLLQYSTGTNKWVNWTPTYISAAITSLNGLTGATQTFATGTTGTDFGISSAGTVHTFNLPIASATNTGKLSSTDWSTFNAKEPALTKGNLTETTSSVLTITGGTGAVIGSGTTIQVASAGASQAGVVTTGTQTFAGAKTFSSDLTINGIEAGRGAGNDSSNTVFGYDVMNGSSTSVAGNTAIGYSAMNANTSGYGNTALGFGSLNTNTTGQSNTAIGLNAGQLIIGSYNTFVGRQAFSQATSGSNNTIIGYAAGLDITSGSNNTLIGGYTGPASALSGNVIISDGSGNIRFLHNGTNGKLPFLTSNGFVKTSGGDGTLSVDTTSYLPLTGGTLTGALSGTSATFSSNFYVNGGTNTNVGNGIHAYYESNYAQIQLNGAAAGGSIIDFSTDGTDYKGRIIYVNSTNQFQFYTNATTALTLSSTGAATFSSSVTAGGSVGVGGTNTDSLLTVNGTAGTSHERFREGSTTVGFVGGANGIITGHNGKLALRAESGLILSGTGNSPDVIIASGGAATFSSSVTSTHNTNGQIAIIPSTNTNAAAFTALNAGGSCYFGKNNSTGGAFTGTAYATVVYSGGDVPMAFYTNDSEKMRITSGGNVGIGTVTPTNGLLVLNSTAANGVRLALESSGTMNGIVALGSNAISGLSTSDMALWTRGVMAFETGASGEKMRITTGGSVGIGTTSPATDFQVVRSGSVTGRFTNTATSVNTEIGVTGGLGYVGTQSANAFGIYTSDTERMRITSGGDIRIGPSTTSSQWYFNYNGTNNKGGISINYSTGEYQIWTGESGNGYYQTFFTNGSERMRITSGGIVSVGATDGLTTSTYAGKLSVYTAGGANLSIGGASNTTNTVMSRLITINNNNGNTGNESSTSFIGITSIESALTTATSNASGNSGGYIMFKTKGDAGTLDERMRITSGGNVEISSGSIKTGAPSGGTAKPWKFGARVAAAGGGLNSGEWIELDVDGTLYKLALFVPL